ncbi:MAG: hypothetical protein LC802_07080 [Acidobacteria bacterium]|nr:hypothetical protein [Acidobacteriota bacterium]
MNRTRHTLQFTLVLAVLVGGGVILPCSSAQAAQQSEGARRPRGGPAAGPVIPLPRGEGEGLEQPPQAEGAKGGAAARSKWEYCAITHTTRKQTVFGSSSTTALAVVRHYPGETEEIEGRNEDDALANAFAKLGEEGWEMVGIKHSIDISDGYGKSMHVYFFKRPK